MSSIKEISQITILRLIKTDTGVIPKYIKTVCEFDILAANVYTDNTTVYYVICFVFLWMKEEVESLGRDV